MANTEGSEGQPPAAWVWSQYRGELPAESTASETLAEAPEPASPALAAETVETAETAGTAEATKTAKNSRLIGLSLAAAIIVVAGLTWLFTTRPASSPAPVEAPATETPEGLQKSETAPAAPEPSPAASAHAIPSSGAPESTAPPSVSEHNERGEHGEHGKRKKKKHRRDD